MIEINKMEDYLKEFNKNYQENLDDIKKFIQEDNEFGRLCLYLLTTERNLNNITKRYYEKENATSFSALLHEIHHALYDDGNITFCEINNVPQFSLEYDFEEDKHTKILNINIDEWIVLSENYHINKIKQNFLIDMQFNPESIEYYKKYKCFDEKWLEELYNKG